MTIEKKNKFYLEHILQATIEIEGFLKGLNEKKFLNEDLVSSAVTKKFENIGEAAKRISEDIKGKYSSIPWKEIAGMRDVLVHDYFGIDYKNVWRTYKQDLPELKKTIKKILKEEY